MIPVNKPALLPLTGAGGIRQSAETSEDLVLDRDGVTDADQSFTQLVAACRRSVAGQGRRFSVLPRLAAEAPGAVVRCGA